MLAWCNLGWYENSYKGFPVWPWWPWTFAIIGKHLVHKMISCLYKIYIQFLVTQRGAKAALARTSITFTSMANLQPKDWSQQEAISEHDYNVKRTGRVLPQRQTEQPNSQCITSTLILIDTRLNHTLGEFRTRLSLCKEPHPEKW